MTIAHQERFHDKKRLSLQQKKTILSLSKSIFRHGYLVLLILLITVSGFCFEFAPLNPDFVDYLDNEPSDRQMLQITDAWYPLGHIPSPVDLSHVDRLHRLLRAFDETADSLQAEQIPASYDLRTTGKLSPVKDQGSCGDCWAYATYGSIESYLLPAESWNFSENDLNVNHGFDPLPCNGGNYFMSMAYLSRYSGPINEDDTSGQVRKHVQKVEYVPCTKYTFTEIKQAVMTYGAVDTSLGWYDSAYKSSTRSYYYNGKSSQNHAVAIVGWNDNYSRANFTITPPGDGAFIIRNSWGTGWGDGGYFYMSYYDTYAGSNCWAFDNAESPINYSTVYQYDPLGWVANVGVNSSTTAWAANIFTATSSVPLAAVGFYASSLNTSYEIKVYSNVTAGKPATGTQAITQSGTLSKVGYITIPLNQSIPLSSGRPFSVVIKFVTPGYVYPVPIQYPTANYSSKAPYGPGKSFLSADGQSWMDISNNVNKSIACIKAFSGPAPSPTPTPSPSPTPTPKPTTVTITAIAGSGGTISPAGSIQVSYGGGKTFTIKPNTGYSVSNVKVNGASISSIPAAGGTYTFSNVTKTSTISAAFKIK